MALPARAAVQKDVIFLEKYNRWHCRQKHPAPQFTLKTQTIFEDSPIGLDKWLTAMWMIVNCKNGISSWEIHRAVKVTQKSAWFMLASAKTCHAGSTPSIIQKSVALKTDPVEVDETFVGGRKQNMHKDKKVRYEAKGGASGKAVVQGILDRTARQVRAKVMPDVKRETLQAEILRQVKYGTKVYTDDAVAYEQGMQWRFVHDFVNKTETYVKGRVHVNGVENFWSLLKRGLNGTYVAVEPFHLERYVDEQVFRYNNRGTEDNPLNDADRFDAAVRQIIGKRLTYAELTGKTDEARECDASAILIPVA